MKPGNKLLILTVVMSFVITACGTSTSTDTMSNSHETMMGTTEPTHDAMMGNGTSMPAMATESPNALTEPPKWFSVSLTNVHTGEAFTVNDLKGKVVLVEDMAVWCTNCFHQQTQVKALRASLGARDDFVTMGMDVDPNEDAPKLKAYIDKNGFDWVYVVAPTEVAREISTIYGSQYLNPTSTPMLIVDRHGATHLLPFGIKSADELQKALQPYLDESM